jgi:hypothetical protein
MDEKAARDRLRQAGFAEIEIYQLHHLRMRYAAKRARLEEFAIFRRMQFIRWLVRTGKLTEQVTRAPELTKNQIECIIKRRRS